MAKVPFLSPKFCGARFETNAMPVEVLPELTAYRELLVAVAKELYRERHPGRKNLPKGFAQRLHLEIKEVRPGSAVPLLERVIATPLLPGMHDEFDDARDLVGRAVEEVAAGRPLPGDFPVKALHAFRDMGRTLRPDEHVLLAAPGHATGPKFDKGVRGSLLLTGAASYPDAVAVVGEIEVIDLVNGTYSIRLEDGQILPVPVALSQDDMKMATSALPGLLPVSIFGVGTFDRGKRLTRINEVHEVVLFEAGEPLTTFNQSLAQLAALPDDWWGEPGGAYQEAHLQQLRWSFYRLALDFGLLLPVLFPVEPGVVRAEWRPRPADVSLEIRMADGTSYVHALNLETGAEFERDGVPFHSLDNVATVLGGLLPQEA